MKKHETYFNFCYVNCVFRILERKSHFDRVRVLVCVVRVCVCVVVRVSILAFRRIIKCVLFFPFIFCLTHCETVNEIEYACCELWWWYLRPMRNVCKQECVVSSSLFGCVATARQWRGKFHPETKKKKTFPCDADEGYMIHVHAHTHTDTWRHIHARRPISMACMLSMRCGTDNGKHCRVSKRIKINIA